MFQNRISLSDESLIECRKPPSVNIAFLALNKEHPPAVIEAEPAKGKGKGKGKGKSKKGKKEADKEPDPELVLELLVDRLCIWHSVGSETSTDGGDSHSKGKDSISEKDHLRHFSVEVIMALWVLSVPLPSL